MYIYIFIYINIYKSLRKGRKGWETVSMWLRRKITRKRSIVFCLFSLAIPEQEVDSVGHWEQEVKWSSPYIQTATAWKDTRHSSLDLCACGGGGRGLQNKLAGDWTNLYSKSVFTSQLRHLAASRNVLLLCDSLQCLKTKLVSLFECQRTPCPGVITL